MNTLPKDVKKRFDEKFPEIVGSLRHVEKDGKLFIETHMIIDRDEAKQFLAEELEKATCDHDWHVPDFGDDVDNKQFATCKKCNAWKE